MLQQENTLNTWLNSLFKANSFQLSPLAGDASFRQYFRLIHDTSRYILMDSSAEKSALKTFSHISKALTKAAVPTPKMLTADLDLGFALLEDLGDTMLFDARLADNIHSHYEQALDVLSTLQSCAPKAPSLLPFDAHAIQEELNLFETWFLTDWLACSLTKAERKLIDQTKHYLITQILKQPTCFMHRDYHSRNLALVNAAGDKPTISVLDFQDAMQGPVAYDLVSLLKDVYIEWPHAQQIQWLNHFYNHLPNQYGCSRDAFEYGFHLCGLQRHLKILGIFCRLNLRDNKPRYLKDLPLTLKYILNIPDIDSTLLPFYDFMQSRVYPAFIEKKIQ